MELQGVCVLIPAFNEQQSIGKVVQEIPKAVVSEIIVIENACTDNTAEVARIAGATVITETRPGYGYACLKGIEYLMQLPIQPAIVVFIDGDYSDYPEELTGLIKPIQLNVADLVIGSRVLGQREKGSMTLQQIFGNWLATRLLRWLYGANFTDLGPFRAIRFDKLIALNMMDTTYGWTVEMQLKASKQKLRCMEVPARYRKRIGISKISGTVKGTVLAGYKIITTIFKYY